MSKYQKPEIVAENQLWSVSGGAIRVVTSAPNAPGDGHRVVFDVTSSALMTELMTDDAYACVGLRSGPYTILVGDVFEPTAAAVKYDPDDHAWTVTRIVDGCRVEATTLNRIAKGRGAASFKATTLVNQEWYTRRSTATIERVRPASPHDHVSVGEWKTPVRGNNTGEIDGVQVGNVYVYTRSGQITTVTRRAENDEMWHLDHEESSCNVTYFVERGDLVLVGGPSFGSVPSIPPAAPPVPVVKPVDDRTMNARAIEQVIADAPAALHRRGLTRALASVSDDGGATLLACNAPVYVEMLTETEACLGGLKFPEPWRGRRAFELVSARYAGDGEAATRAYRAVRLYLAERAPGCLPAEPTAVVSGPKVKSRVMSRGGCIGPMGGTW